MPKRIGLPVAPSLNPLIIRVVSRQIMARQKPPALRQLLGGGEPHVGPVERIVEGLEVGPRHELIEGGDGEGHGSGRHRWVERRRVVGGGGLRGGIVHDGGGGGEESVAEGEEEAAEGS